MVGGGTRRVGGVKGVGDLEREGSELDGTRDKLRCWEWAGQHVRMLRNRSCTIMYV